MDYRSLQLLRTHLSWPWLVMQPTPSVLWPRLVAWSVFFLSFCFILFPLTRIQTPRSRHQNCCQILNMKSCPWLSIKVLQKKLNGFRFSFPLNTRLYSWCCWSMLLISGLNVEIYEWRSDFGSDMGSQSLTGCPNLSLGIMLYCDFALFYLEDPSLRSSGKHLLKRPLSFLFRLAGTVVGVRILKSTCSGSTQTIEPLSQWIWQAS